MSLFILCHWAPALIGSQTYIIAFVRTIQNKVEPLVGDMAASQRKKTTSGKTAGQSAALRTRDGQREKVLALRRQGCRLALTSSC